MRIRAFLTVLVLLAGLTSGPMGLAGSAVVGDSLVFRVSFPSHVRGTAANGRVFVMVSRHGHPQPRFQVDITDGAPFWGKDVQGLRPGEAATAQAIQKGAPAGADTSWIGRAARARVVTGAGTVLTPVTRG